MTLIPQTNTLGLWQDPQWAPGMPGLYALIIGVSSYPHLKDGSAPAKETFDLGQLEVSASTAAAVFDWLRWDYEHAHLPVVWCYLLLSPSKAEEQFLKSEDIIHYENPTDSMLRKAIQLWCSYLPTQSDPAKKSRTLFFFSGHGIQSNWDPLILPSDYLFPPDGNPILENCVNSNEMLKWMSTHPVKEHLAILDACRNEFSPLSTKGSTANRVFPMNPVGSPPRVVARMSATAPNSVAYQSSKVEDLTFFGRALIEGLDGTGGTTSVDSAGGSNVEFMELVKYIKPRVMKILQEHETSLEQTADPYLYPPDENLIVTTAKAEELHPSRSFGPVFSTKNKPPLNLPETSWPEQAEIIHDSHFNISFDGPIPFSTLRDFSTAHHYFGHEYASDLWADFQLSRLRDRRILGDDQMRVQRVTRNDESTIVRIDLQFLPNHGGVLAMFGRIDQDFKALPLPTDESGSVPIRLTMAFDYNGLQRVEGQLGPSMRPHYSYLWKLSRIANFASFTDAAKEADPGKLIAAVEDKMQATTAAIAGAIILACGGKIQTVGNWTYNLMNWFPDIPDGAVLWAESLRSSLSNGNRHAFGESDPLGAMANALGSLEHRGIPFFVDAINLLNSQLQYLDGVRDLLSDPQKLSLDAVRRMTNQVFQISRPSGHFLMITDFPHTVNLEPPDKIERILNILRPR
jgi:hypothetical protein